MKQLALPELWANWSAIDCAPRSSKNRSTAALANTAEIVDCKIVAVVCRAVAVVDTERWPIAELELADKTVAEVRV